MSKFMDIFMLSEDPNNPEHVAAAERAVTFKVILRNEPNSN